MLTHYVGVGQTTRRSQIRGLTDCGRHPGMTPMGERINSTPLRMELDLSFGSLRGSEATDRCFMDLLERLQYLAATVSGSIQGAEPTACAVGASRADACSGAASLGILPCPWDSCVVRATKRTKRLRPLGSSTPSSPSTGDFVEQFVENCLSVVLEQSFGAALSGPDIPVRET